VLKRNLKARGQLKHVAVSDVSGWPRGRLACDAYRRSTPHRLAAAARGTERLSHTAVELTGLD